MKKLYTVSKNKTGRWVWLRSTRSPLQEHDFVVVARLSLRVSALPRWANCAVVGPRASSCRFFARKSLPPKPASAPLSLRSPLLSLNVGHEAPTVASLHPRTLSRICHQLGCNFNLAPKAAVWSVTEELVSDSALWLQLSFLLWALLLTPYVTLKSSPGVPWLETRFPAFCRPCRVTQVFHRLPVSLGSSEEVLLKWQVFSFPLLEGQTKSLLPQIDLTFTGS